MKIGVAVLLLVCVASAPSAQAVKTYVVNRSSFVVLASTDYGTPAGGVSKFKNRVIPPGGQGELVGRR